MIYRKKLLVIISVLFVICASLVLAFVMNGGKKHNYRGILVERPVQITQIRS